MTLPERDRRWLPTPFHERTSAACETNEWYQWKAWTAVSCYTTVQEEYFAIRNAAGLFDMSPISKYRITGPDARAYLDRVVTRDLSAVVPGRVTYCPWCNDDGKVLDDGTLFCFEESRWRLCSQERHLDWLLWCAEGFDVEVVEETEDVAALALQGPTSCRVLKALGLAGIEELRPFHCREFSAHGIPLMVSRTGFTGDLGYELWVHPSAALQLWDRLAEAGAPFGLRPVGAHALDIARIEAGFLQAWVDFVPAGQAVRPDRTRSPFELGMEKLVHFAKPVFNGRRALLEEREKGSRYRLVKLDVEGNKPAKDSFIYDARRRVVGTVTSAVWAPSAKCNIAIASVRRPYGEPGDRLWAEIYYNRELQWNRVMARCRVVERPFFDPPRRRAVPAPDY